MSRLIDADKIDFNEVFVGTSEFAQDTRNAAQLYGIYAAWIFGKTC